MLYTIIICMHNIATGPIRDWLFGVSGTEQKALTKIPFEIDLRFEIFQFEIVRSLHCCMHMLLYAIFSFVTWELPTQKNSNSSLTPWICIKSDALSMQGHGTKNQEANWTQF